MTHPYFSAECARQRQIDLLGAAERNRLARRARPDRVVRNLLRGLGTAIGNVRRLSRRRSSVVEATLNTRTASRVGPLPANRDKPVPVDAESAATRIGSDS